MFVFPVVVVVVIVVVDAAAFVVVVVFQPVVFPEEDKDMAPAASDHARQYWIPHRERRGSIHRRVWAICDSCH